MTAPTTLKFSAAEDALFGELVVVTITALRSAKFSVGEYVGGQADMSCDQQIHTMLEYAEIIDSKLSYRLSSQDLRKHLVNASRFGITLDWLLECFFLTLREHHVLGWDNPLFSYDPFKTPETFAELISALTEAGYVKQSNGANQWIGKARPVLSLMFWGYATSRGAEAREEVTRIMSSLPMHWREMLAKPRSDWSLNDRQKFEMALSNHWYNEKWNETPVRGQRDEVYLRSEMGERASLILALSE